MSDNFKIEELPDSLIIIFLTYVPTYQYALDLPKLSLKLKYIIEQKSTFDVYKRETKKNNCKECLSCMYGTISHFDDSPCSVELMTCIQCYAIGYRGFPDKFFEDVESCQQFDDYLEVFGYEGENVEHFDVYEFKCRPKYATFQDFLLENDREYMKLSPIYRSCLDFEQLWTLKHSNEYYVSDNNWYFYKFDK